MPLGQDCACYTFIVASFFFLFVFQKFQRGGDLVEAAKWMDEARILDTADRFVNCKCVKYLFRVNRIERAIEVAGLFTRVSAGVGVEVLDVGVWLR